MTDLERCEELTDILSAVNSVRDRLDKFCGDFEAGGREIVETTESVEIAVRDFNRSLEIGGGRFEEARAEVQNWIDIDDKRLDILSVALRDNRQQFEFQIDRDRATMDGELDEVRSVLEGVRETCEKLGRTTAQTVAVVIGELKISGGAIANLQTQVATNQDEITTDFDDMSSEIRDICDRVAENLIQNFGDISDSEVFLEMIERFDVYAEKITDVSDNFIARISGDADRLLLGNMASLETATDRVNDDLIPDLERSLRDATDRGIAEMKDAIEDCREAAERGEKMTASLNIILPKIVSSRNGVSS